MTKRVPTPPGFDNVINANRDEVTLREILSDELVKPTEKIQHWLTKNHRRNALIRDITSMARHMDSMRLWLRVGVAMLILVFLMQLMLWFAG